MSKFVHDPIEGKIALFSENRNFRKSDNSRCPFCPGNEDVLEPKEKGYCPLYIASSSYSQRHVVVIPNGYNALAIEPGLDERTCGIFRIANGLGVHEVVIEHPYSDHRLLTQLTVQDVDLILGAWKARLLDLVRDSRLAYPLVYRNNGRPSGQSVPHLHSQIMVFPFVPPEVEGLCGRFQNFYEKSGRCLLCRMIDVECNFPEDENLIITRNEAFVAWVYRAGIMPYEFMIAPRLHYHRFEWLPTEMHEAFADIYLRTIRAFDRVSSAVEKGFDFNAVLRTYPWFENIVGRSPLVSPEAFHWYIKFYPRSFSIMAGCEFGVNIFINTVAPVDAAKCLRSAIA